MFLAVDCGNTRIKATLIDSEGGCLRHSFANSEANDFMAFVAASGASGGAMMASGKVDVRIAESLRMLLKDGFLLMTPATQLPIGITYGNPEGLGLDRKAAAMAVWRIFPGEDAVVVDAGTAVTIDIVGKEGFRKGNISPGLDMRFRALAEFTAALPRVDWRYALNKETPDKDEKDGGKDVDDRENYDTAGNGEACGIASFGGNTREAIACGVVNGFLDEIAAAISRAGSEGTGRVVVTGGDSLMLKRYLPERLRNAGIEIELIFEPDLIAKGLYAIYEYYEDK